MNTEQFSGFLDYVKDLESRHENVKKTKRLYELIFVLQYYGLKQYPSLDIREIVSNALESRKLYLTIEVNPVPIVEVGFNKDKIPETFEQLIELITPKQ